MIRQLVTSVQLVLPGRASDWGSTGLLPDDTVKCLCLLRPRSVALGFPLYLTDFIGMSQAYMLRAYAGIHLHL